MNSHSHKESKEWIPFQNCQKTDVESIIVEFLFLIQFIELAFVEYLSRLNIDAGNGLKLNQNVLFNGKQMRISSHSSDYLIRFYECCLLVYSAEIHMSCLMLKEKKIIENWI